MARLFENAQGDENRTRALQRLAGTVAKLVLGTPEHTFETPIASNTAITVAEIETAIAGAGLDVPHDAVTIFVHDTTVQGGDKMFECHYDENVDVWYYVKLIPSPALASEINATHFESLQASVSSASKITRAEIETCLTINGFALPSGDYNFTLYINDMGRANKMYQCRYDKTQDAWFSTQLRDEG